MSADSKQHALIIGSGIFGVSTAIWMLESGRYDVTVLDKSGILPAPDAASTDLNKIIRAGDYADPGLAELGVEAVEMWRKPEWEGTFHESGVISLASSKLPSAVDYVSSAYQNCLSMSIEAKDLPDIESIKGEYSSAVSTGDFAGRSGYFNPISGWAEAGRATAVGIKKVRQLSGTIRVGCEIVGLLHEGRRVSGVKLRDGEEIKGDVVVSAAGAWTPQLFAHLGAEFKPPPVVATGQSIASVQLIPEEVAAYSKTPVVLCIDNGFYVFPPNPDGIVKFALHAAGYTNPQDGTGVSVPRTKLTPGAEDGMIPLEKLRSLRADLAEIYPELAKKDIISTRLCWYSDTESGDWVIDRHPEFDNFVLATGDSGHAFKYFPVIGREILKVLEGKPDPRFAQRWGYDARVGEAGADVRVDERRVLKVEELATAADLKA